MKQDQMTLWAEKLYKHLASGNKQERLYIQFIEGLVHRVQDNKDAVICVCGERGMGKSSFALISALLLRRYGISFSEAKLFHGSEYLESAIGQIINTRSNAYIFDEMIDFAYSRDAMSALNKNIAKILTKARKLNHIYFFCIPRFRNLDSTIRNDVVHFWIEVFWKSEAKEHSKKFAMASLFRKDKNPLADDPWGITKNKYEHRRVFTPHQQLRIMKRIRSFTCALVFPPLPLALEKHYEQQSRDSIKAAGDKWLATLQLKKPIPDVAHE